MNPFHIPDKAYDFLKQIALITIPGIASACIMLGQLWGWDADTVAQMVGTLTVIDTVLGAFLGISTKAYNNSDERFDGVLHTSIEDATGVQLYSLELNQPPEALSSKSSIVFKVGVPSDS